jgi:hypothetical protein
MLDELVVLEMREVQFRYAKVAIEDSELQLLVAHEGGVFGESLDVHTGPGVKLIGDLIDECGRM